MDPILTIRAIHRLRPNSEWVLDEHTGLKFFDETISVPTDAEIQQAIEEIKTEDAEKIILQAVKRQAALDKLAALGLNTDDLKALGL
jgi:hypothetical protein